MHVFIGLLCYCLCTANLEQIRWQELIWYSFALKLNSAWPTTLACFRWPLVPAEIKGQRNFWVRQKWMNQRQQLTFSLLSPWQFLLLKTKSFIYISFYACYPLQIHIPATDPSLVKKNKKNKQTLNKWIIVPYIYQLSGLHVDNYLINEYRRVIYA